MKQQKTVPIIAKTDNQKALISGILSKDIVLVDGPPGTGKTFVVIGLACQLLSSGKIQKIVMTRATEHISNRCGFSTGSYKEKASEYFAQQRAYFEYFLGKQLFKKLYDDGAIEICLLENMRGMNYESTFMILDEAQECIKDDVLLFQSRISNYSKMAICGDREQTEGGSTSFFEKMIDSLRDESLVKVIFTEEDVMRHKDMYRIYRKIKAIQ